jgi:hypothetical protein
MKFQHRVLVLLIFVALLFSGQGHAFALPYAGEAGRPEVMPLVDGLEIRWTAGEPVFAQGTDGAISVQVAGFDRVSTPGAPRLPVGVALIALPPGAQPALELLEAVEERLPAIGAIERAGQPLGIITGPGGQPLGGAYAPAEERMDFAPQVVEFEELGVLRGVRLGRLLYYPLLPAEDGLRWVGEIRARLIFNLPPGTAIQDFTPQSQRDPIIQSIQDAVLNPSQVIPASPVLGMSAPASLQESGPFAILEVDVDSNPGYVPVGGGQAGDDTPLDLPYLVDLSYEALQAIGFPVATVSPVDLQLTHGGVEVAMRFTGNGNAAFEPGEKFQFLAFPRVSRWTHKDTYLLRVGAGPGLRMTEQPASPSGTAASAVVEKVFERNKIYTPDCNCGSIPAGWDGDHWVWEELKVGGAASRTYTFSLPSLASNQPGVLTLWAISYTNVLQNPDHQVEVKLNNTTLAPTVTGSDQWDGRAARKITFTIPANLLEGSNTLVVNLPGISDGAGGKLVEGMWLDAYAVQYRLGSAAAGARVLFQGEATQKQYTVKMDAFSELAAFDVSDENQPKRLTGYGVSGTTVNLGDPAGGGAHRYLLVTGAPIIPTLRLPVGLAAAQAGFQGADYVIISPPAFNPALASLVSLRQGRGRTVLLENLQAIYDHYGEGRLSPQAIQAYLADAYQNWSIKPLYVLLVGDGTFDPKKYYAASFETYLPPYLADVDPWAGETASDNRFATVDGADPLPDLLIGRLPVNSLAEAQAVVNKIIAYETALPSGSWQQTALLVADNADDGGDFPAESEALAAVFPSSFVLQRHYLPAAAKSGLITAWNAGAKFVAYVGHSSVHQWASEELLHAISNVPPPATEPPTKLKNGGKQPIVVEMTCFTGMFHTSSLEVLDERLLRAPSAGAVAVLAPTGLGLSPGHLNLAQGFFEYAFAHPQSGIGLAMLKGKLDILNSFNYQDLIDTYLLLGDSDLSLQLPSTQDVYLPLVRR